jgi:hypothetical protein
MFAACGGKNWGTCGTSGSLPGIEAAKLISASSNFWYNERNILKKRQPRSGQK